MAAPHEHLYDPDAALAAETTDDLRAARARGHRIRALAEDLASRLHGAGMLRGSQVDAIIEMQHVIATAWYGNRAVDLIGRQS